MILNFFGAALARMFRRKAQARSAVPGVRRSTILREVSLELDRAKALHVDWRSSHEGWALLYEEVQELFDEVRKNPGLGTSARKAHRQAMRREAIQVAACAIRFITDVCDGGK